MPDEASPAVEVVPETPVIAVPEVTPQNAQMRVKICFWHNPRTDHILQGGPEWVKPVYGYNQIVCNHAHEAEMWSKRLNEQDKRICEMTQAERILIEGKMISDLREETKKKLAQATDFNNKYILETVLKSLDKADEKLREKELRESFLHVEAYEHGR